MSHLKQTLRAILYVAALIGAASPGSEASQTMSFDASQNVLPPAPPAPPVLPAIQQGAAPRPPGQPKTLPTPPAPPALPGERPDVRLDPRPPANAKPVNIKVDLTISDHRGSEPAVVKQVSAIAGDGLQTFIRSETIVPGRGTMPLNVDVVPTLLEANKIRLRLTLQFGFALGEREPRQGDPLTTNLTETVGVVLEDGKQMVVTQSADPLTDRRVTVEVKASILK